MMLIIQGQSNLNYLSLAERLTVVSGYQVLVRLISEDSLYDTSVIPVVASGTHGYRYHTLTITEKDNATTGERQAGSVTLDPYGMYLYEAYQQSTSGSTTYTQASATLNLLIGASNGDTFTIHLPAEGSNPATDLVFTFRTVPILETDIAINASVSLQGLIFASTIGSYIQVNNPGIFLNADPPDRTVHQFLAVSGGVFDGVTGNGITLSWSNPALFSQVSPVTLSGGDAVINLDYTIGTTLLETGKCLVTPHDGFPVTNEYSGQTSVTYSG